ncbi:MAG: tetratricopeptide repeat protein, partial [Fimbriimonas ginsengisoli]|nr:tetratricopeptide repeat protein [Fimbriimonas ginsengisoli]
ELFILARLAFKATILLLLLAAACCGHRLLSITRATAGQPAAPACDRPPYDPARAFQVVSFYEGRVRRDPEGAISLRMLAQAYLQRCREIGDAADAVRAESAARKSLKILPRHNGPAQCALAQSLAVQHRFREALDTVEVEMRRDPADLSAIQIAAEAALELGRYDRAWKIVRSVQGKGAREALRDMTARLLEIDGHPAEAITVLRAALRDAERNPDTPHEALAWRHVRIAGLLRQLRREDDAISSYRTAIEVFPHDYRALLELAKLYADRKEWAQALPLASKSAEIVPSPETMALIGDCQIALGNPAEAKRAFAMVDAAHRLTLNTQHSTIDRQRAIYLADHGQHLDEALVLARAEVKARQYIFAYDTLAWVSYRSGRIQEA